MQPKNGTKGRIKTQHTGKYDFMTKMQYDREINRVDQKLNQAYILKLVTRVKALCTSTVSGHILSRLNILGISPAKAEPHDTKNNESRPCTSALAYSSNVHTGYHRRTE